MESDGMVKMMILKIKLTFHSWFNGIRIEMNLNAPLILSKNAREKLYCFIFLQYRSDLFFFVIFASLVSFMVCHILLGYMVSSN